MSELKSFTNSEFGTLQIVTINGKEYFPATDCAKILGYANPQKAIRTHCKGVNEMDTPSNSGTQKKNYITEGDLYRLIIRSKLPSAEKFELWVFDEILPQIRKTGGYIPVNEMDDENTIMAKALKIADKTIQEKDNLILQLKPKAEMCDKFLNSQGFVSMNKAAKGLKVGRNKMMAFLRTLSILFRDDNDNMPYQQYVTSGYFTVDYHNGRDGKLHAVTKVSAKGIEFIHKLYRKYATVKAVA